VTDTVGRVSSVHSLAAKYRLMQRPDIRHAVLMLAVLCAGCSRRDSPAPSAAARAAHKAGIAAAARDRMVLQYLVKRADTVNKRLPTLRRVTSGFLRGDTSVIWFGYFAGDSLLVLDETRRGPAGVEENARYLFRDSALTYVVLDRIASRSGDTPVRLRLAFGFDSAGVLSATSKNVNDAAQPLDTAADIGRVVTRAHALREQAVAHPR
jgi:hypothetical protein